MFFSGSSRVDRGLIDKLESYGVFKKASFRLTKSFIAVHLLEKKQIIVKLWLFETLLIVKMAFMNVNDIQTALNATWI